MKLSDLLVDHDFYASPTNYNDNNVRLEYDNWNEFYTEFKDADIDYNLVYRWDLTLEESNIYELQIVHINQGKGIYKPIIIKNIVEENVDEIQQYLTIHFEYMLSIWQPISDKFVCFI